LFRVESDRVMLTRELLNAEVSANDPTYDKLFGSCYIAAAVESSVVGQQKRWGLHIDEAPIVAFKDKTKMELGLHSDTPTVDQMRDLGLVDIGRENLPYGRFSLVSGGTIIYYDNKLLCLRRDMFAKQDPGLLTTPAGRMSEWLSTMSVLELAEEMIIILRHEATGKLVTIGGYRQSRRQLSENDVLVKKLKQIGKMYEFYNEKESSLELKILKEIKGIDDIMPVDLDQFVCRNTLNEKSDLVFTFDRYKTVDQCSGFVFFDKKNNTLEYREVFDLTLPGFSLYAIMPGEYFQTNQGKVANDTQILSRNELMGGAKNNMVPTLRAYVSGLESGSVVNFFSDIVSRRV
jgi:hypothetical protein